MFDPEVIQVPEGDFIYYGSYFGGISVRELSSDLLHSDPATQTNVAIANKYEGAEVVRHDGWYYLFASATDCCRGPLTGYAVLVGRSAAPTGPFLDRSGVDLNDDETPADPTDGRAGGSPVIVGNDDPWVGTGHNTVFEDVAGQWWTIYHAVDRNEPYFEGAVGFTKRPVLLDAIDWVDGWPTVNGGSGISTAPMPAPAAQPGDTTAHVPSTGVRDQQGARIASLSDAFGGSTLADQWSWIREPAADTWSISGGRLRIETQAADLFEGSNDASVLVEARATGQLHRRDARSPRRPRGRLLLQLRPGRPGALRRRRHVREARGRLDLEHPPDGVGEGGAAGRARVPALRQQHRRPAGRLHGDRADQLPARAPGRTSGSCGG